MEEGRLLDSLSSNPGVSEHAMVLALWFENDLTFFTQVWMLPDLCGHWYFGYQGSFPSFDLVLRGWPRRLLISTPQQVAQSHAPKVQSSAEAGHVHCFGLGCFGLCIPRAVHQLQSSNRKEVAEAAMFSRLCAFGYTLLIWYRHCINTGNTVPLMMVGTLPLTRACSVP